MNARVCVCVYTQANAYKVIYATSASLDVFLTLQKETVAVESSSDQTLLNSLLQK